MTIQRETKEQIDRLVSGLTQEEAEDLLDYLSMKNDPDTLSDEELKEFRAGREEIKRGEYFTREQLRDKHGV
ncbi:MAG TPA: hypothetical protein VFO84_02380 [Dehalococcoidia bacterium]|nr:hypothetical protein [Dehalococcoidia bacterium]